MNSRYDSWLTTQPEQSIVHIVAPNIDADYDNYPVDEWQCRDCHQPLGFYLAGDIGGGWTDAWWIEKDDQHLCQDCFESVTAEDIDIQPDCVRCGAFAGDEHRDLCEMQ